MIKWLVVFMLAAEVWHLLRFRTRCTNLRKLSSLPVSHAYVSALEKTGELHRFWKRVGHKIKEESFAQWMTTTDAAPNAYNDHD
jgi:hypothetical protein